MAIDIVKDYLKRWGRDVDIIELETSSATVELAAKALGVDAARIAKTISFKANNGAILIVAAGDAKTDNSKFKVEFGIKAKMLTPDEALQYIGHSVGGVCPFGVKENVAVFLDISLRRFNTIFPACGSSNSAIELTCEEIDEYSLNKKWVDVCKGWCV
ncbi:MAG: YbaK/EbsC family protein [Clostridiaceae bacterium]|nr:YbaK/EbsC family protein [Clostridiaceae bacterium]